jgi:hypothetical protein
MLLKSYAAVRFERRLSIMKGKNRLSRTGVKALALTPVTPCLNHFLGSMTCFPR